MVSITSSHLSQLTAQVLSGTLIVMSHIAFQTAVALADFGNEKDEDGKILLKDTHIMQVVRMSEEFKTYLKTLHQGDESKRAERQRIRLDAYDAGSAK